MELFPIGTDIDSASSPVSSETPNAAKALKKKKKVSKNEYVDVRFIPPTSNIVERLFSAARLVLTDYQKCMSLYTFECIMFLMVNKTLWDSSLVSNIVLDMSRARVPRGILQLVDNTWLFKKSL